MPTSPIHSGPPSPSISVNYQQSAKPDKTRSRKDYFPETVNNLGQIFRDFPDLSKGTLKGIGSITGQYQDASPDNYLFSLDATDSIIVTLYNTSPQKGVVCHLDENKTVEDEVRKAIDFLGGAHHAEKIEAHLIGGVWFGAGEQLGDRIRETLRSYKIEPTWQDWSFTPCYGHRYGATLELRHGDLLVFEHTTEMGVDFWRNKWKAAQISSQAVVEQNHRARQNRDPAGVNSMTRSNGVSHSGSVESVNSLGSTNSLDSFSTFNDIPPKIISLKNSVGAVEYELIGEDKCVKGFRNAFNAKVDNKRCEYAEKTRPEITAFLEGVKQALQGEEKIELRIIKPTRRTYSSPGSSQHQSYLVTNAPGRSATTTPKPFFTNSYTRQEKCFSADQKEMVLKELVEINDGIDRFRKKSHTADTYRFSRPDQGKIFADYGKETTKLYSYPLPKWEGGDKGKGKWRLIYKQEGNRISFFGVYDTHKYIYTAYA